MNRQDLIDYLANQKWINRQLEKYIEQKSIVERITQNLDGMPKAQNKPNYAVEELMDKYDFIIKMLIQDQMKQNEIILILREMPTKYRDILWLKYIDGKSLQEIADEIPMAYDNVCRLHGEALNEFDEICESRQ